MYHIRRVDCEPALIPDTPKIIRIQARLESFHAIVVQYHQLDVLHRLVNPEKSIPASTVKGFFFGNSELGSSFMT